MTNLVRVLALSSLLFACKDKAADSGGKAGAKGDTVASCNAAALGTCVEYNKDNLAAGSDSIAKMCTVVDKTAVFTMTACPTAGVTASCAGPEHKDYFYAAYPISADDNEKSCKASGKTFTRGK
jgi:hypothetical protein